MKSFKRVLAFLVVASILVLSTACGSSDAPASSAPASSAAPASSEAPEAKTWEPNGNVNVIVAYGAGGSSDLVARAFTTQGASSFKTPMVVNNMAGGGCAIGFTELIQAKPDGMTIGNTNSAVIVNCLVSETPYTYYEELQPLVQVGYAPYVVYVRKDSEIQNLDDLKAAILSRDVVMACNNRGGQTHWELEYFALENGGDISSIIYDGGASSIAALLGGHAEVTVQAPSDGQEYVKSGDLRAIAILDSNRLNTEIYKDVPTSEEQGYGWLQNGFFHGYAAPKGVSDEVIAYYEKCFKEALENPEVKAIVEGYGFTVAYEDHEGFQKVWDDGVKRYSSAFEKLGDRLTE